jgi:hypothetical protein
MCFVVSEGESAACQVLEKTWGEGSLPVRLSPGFFEILAGPEEKNLEKSHGWCQKAVTQWRNYQ